MLERPSHAAVEGKMGVSLLFATLNNLWVMLKREEEEEEEEETCRKNTGMEKKLFFSK